jgi:iron complex transport system ATP-binding protein
VALLEARQLELRRGNRVLLSNLSFELLKAGLYFLTGPNGSGKSTLLLTLAGLLAPAAGQVAVGGVHLYGTRKLLLKERARTIVYLPQNATCPDEFTALDLAALGRLPYKRWQDTFHKEDYALARTALSQIGFKPDVGQAMGALSGGERQLVWLAQGITQNGTLWLLDEPSQHLDAARREHLFNTLTRLATDFGKTLLVATHELDYLARIPQAYFLDLLSPEIGFVPCTQEALAKTYEAHKRASGLF